MKSDNQLNEIEVRRIVLAYNKIYDARLAIEAIANNGEPNSYIDRILAATESVDLIVKRPLSNYVNNTVVGKWAMSQVGVGPVFTAGLMSYVDVTKAKTATSVWRYAGFDPVFNSNPRMSYNGDLKNVCLKIGQSFSRHSTKKNCFYGKLYLQDKARRIRNNDNGEYSEQAFEALMNVNSKNKDTIAVLQSGKLPDEQIEQQSRRFAVKIFLSHYHTIAYQEHYGTAPYRPNFINIDGEEQEINIPNNPY